VSEARRLANTKTVRAKPENLPVLNNKLAFIFFVFHRSMQTLLTTLNGMESKI